VFKYAGAQDEMEEMLNKTFQKLEAEEVRREKIEREIKEIELQRVWGVKVQDAQKGVDEVAEKLSQLENRMKWPAGKSQSPASFSVASNSNKSTDLGVRGDRNMALLEDSGVLLLHELCVVLSDAEIAQ
jgi:hypothetical protein